MQRTIYQCDQCQEEIGKQPHITINFAGNGSTSGIALPPKSECNSNGGWFVQKFDSTWVHLHAKCVSKFFADAFAKATKKT